MRSNTHWNLNCSNATGLMAMFIISASSPRWPFPVREPCRAPEWKEALNMNAAEINKFKFPFFDRPGRHYPGFQRAFFPVVCGENWSAMSRSWRAVFFPLVTIAASPLNFRHKQQGKEPLAPRIWRHVEDAMVNATSEDAKPISLWSIARG